MSDKRDVQKQKDIATRVLADWRCLLTRDNYKLCL